MASSRYLDPSNPLPTRDTADLTVTQDTCLSATNAEAVTSQATAEDIRIELPSASDYPGLTYTITHSTDGSGFLTEVVDEDQNVIARLSYEGRSVTVESDGTGWASVDINTEVPRELPPEIRVWDSDLCKYRQATSYRDAFDAVYALLKSCVEVMQDEGVTVPPELEAFHEST